MNRPPAMTPHIGKPSIIRTVTPIFLLTFLVLSLSIAYTYLNSPQHTSSTPRLSPSLSHPSPLSTIYLLRRPVLPKQPLPFTDPQILAVYKIPHIPTGAHDIFIYASGVNVGQFSRNLTVLGCLIGRSVYRAVVNSTYDIFKCVVPHPPAEDAVVSLLLENDAVLKKALSGEYVRLRTINATSPRGVIVDPPEGIVNLKSGSPQRVPYGTTKMITSNVTWSTFPTDTVAKGEIESKPRYHICLVTMVKPFADALQPWITYHRRLGVDMVYILDNIANHSISDEYQSRDDVEVLYWPFDRSQVQGLSYILHTTRTRCDWLLAADVDEFVMLGIEGVGHVRPLEWYLKEKTKRNETMSKFGYIDIFGNRTTVARDPMPLAYIHKGSQKHPWQGKSVCRTNFEWRLHLVHDCAPQDLGVHSLPDEADLNGPVHVSGSPKVIHYKRRSWEELKEKGRIGSASVIDVVNGPSDRLRGEIPTWFAELTKGTQKWTRFRDVYNTITRMYNENEQTLVWRKDGRQCELKRNILTGSEERIACLTGT